MEISDYFSRFSSNTYAGSGNQYFFTMPKDEIRCGRVFYKITEGGTYHYSILFSNTIDSTFEDGSISRKNTVCALWKIHNAKIGRCKNIPDDKELSKMVMDKDIIVSDFFGISFDGKPSKEVTDGNMFASDPIESTFQKGEYLCLEIVFSGTQIPYHEETLLPVYVKNQDGWSYDKKMPFASMIGCDRKVTKRIGYFGDSITQGIGTKENSYSHWNALLSEKLGNQYSYWNSGLGYGRANDAASDGIWMEKALKNDIVFVCFGVNDILQGQSEEQIKSDLAYIVNKLKNANKKVILQTIPPFDYQGEQIPKWNQINSFIKTELKNKVDFLFDAAALLGEKNAPQNAKYGGHPNEEGCKIWAEALYAALKENHIL